MSHYDRTAIVDEICARLAQGEPLAAICRELHMPDRSVVYDWANADEQVARRIARARSVGFDAIADECQLIADSPVVGEEVTLKPDGTQEVRRGDMLGHRKLQIDTRLKLLAKWDPKRYGERSQVEVSNPDGSLQLDETARAARLARLLELARERKEQDSAGG